MKRGLAIVSMVAMLGASTPFAYAAPQTTSTYTVKSGDSLWKIAQINGVTVAQLEQANNITNPNLLQIDQVLTIPSASTTGGTSSSDSTTTYTVKSGDTLWKISQSFGVFLQSILQANSLSNPDQLSVGQTLTIPSPTNSSTTDSTTTTAGSTTYTVTSGDTLWKISQAAGVTIQAIVQANNLVDAKTLYVGEVLTIPSSPTGGTTGTTRPSTTSTTTTSADGTATWTTGTDTAIGVAYKIGIESNGDPVHNLVANGSDSERFQIAVTDSIGNWVGSGIPVIITSDNPTVATVSLPSSSQAGGASVTGVTSNGGFVFAVNAAKSTGTGVVHIIATYGNIKTTQEIQVVGNPTKITLTGATTFSSQSTGVHYVTSTVTDANGNPLPGVIVHTYCNNVIYWFPQYGPVKTNSKGQAIIGLTSNGKAGTANLDISVENGTTRISVPITTN